MSISIPKGRRGSQPEHLSVVFIRRKDPTATRPEATTVAIIAIIVVIAGQIIAAMVQATAITIAAVPTTATVIIGGDKLI